MKKVVINFASGAWYPKGQVRLGKSLKDTGFDGDFIGVQTPSRIGSPTHQEVPYAFKTYLLIHCRKSGHDQAIYADASIYAVKTWEPIWAIISDQGYYFEEAGHWAGTWTKDSVLKRMGITRDEAMTIPMFSAGFVGLDFRNSLANEFLDRWHAYAMDGDSFKGAWNNKNGQMSKDPRCKGHRHDMSVASILAWQMKMKLGEGGQFLAYRGPGYGNPKESVVAYLQPC